MDVTCLRERALQHLRKLCVEIPNRRVGSEGNRAATSYFATVVLEADFAVSVDEFDCIDWATEGVALLAGGRTFRACASPYSLGCDVSAPLVVVETVNGLASADARGSVLLMRGDVVREQLMPKGFPFYNPEHHQALMRLLEEKMPAVIITATTRDPVMVGSQYPFPVFEDGDFDIPSVYMTPEEGDELVASAGTQVSTVSRARRISSKGGQVSARKGRNQIPRVVLFAHIDSRMGTPGANDNASGTATLLVLAELLADYSGRLGVEIVAVNGEDYYGANGEVRWVASNAGRFGEIRLGINLDDVAYCEGRSAYSLYGCPDGLARAIRGSLSPYTGLVEGDAWYQGDHMLFVANHVPAVAVTDELVQELMVEITHTPLDTIEIVDPGKIATLAEALRGLIAALNGAQAWGVRAARSGGETPKCQPLRR